MNMKNILLVLLVLAFISQANAQNPRPLWRGDAYVGGDFDVRGPNGATAESYSATTTVKAATFVAGASEVQINIPRSGSDLDDYGLIYDDAVGDVSLRPIPAGTVAALDDITDVSATNKVSEDLLQWTGSQWEATRITSILNSLDAIGNVDTTGKLTGDVLYWTGAVWSATPQASGGGASNLGDLGDVTITTPSDNDYLQYDSGSGDWINQAFNEVLNAISDVDAGSPSNNDVLTYNSVSGNWEAQAGGGARSNTITIAAVNAANAADYDYQCDGIDDHVTINAAMATLDSATGGMVVLSEGTFYIAGEIKIATDFISLSGQGPRATILQRAWNAGVSDVGVIRVDTPSGGDGVGTIIRDLGIDGQSATYPDINGIGIVANYSDQCYFENLYIADCAGEGIKFLQNVDSSVVNCYITNCLQGLDLAAGVYELVVIGCVFDANDQEGFISTAGKRITLSGCIAKNNGTKGFQLGGNWNTISGCIALGNGQDGFEISSNYSTVSNNVAYNNTIHGFQIAIADFVTLSGNIATNNGWSGIFVDTGSASCNIVGNYSANNANHGIRVYNTANFCNVNDNYVYSNDDNGIYVHVANGTHVSGNFFIQNAADELRIGSDVNRIMVQGNYFYDPTNYAVAISYSSNIWIKDNTFEANTSLGESNAVVSIDDSFSGDSDRIFLYSNTYLGSWTGGDYTLQAGQAIKPIILMSLTTGSGALGEAIILSSSASAKIGLATDDASTITNILTVASGSTTDPIADAWTVWSVRQLKENIESVTPEHVEYDNAEDFIMNAPMIKFDWKGPGEPKRESFKDVVDPESGQVYATADDLYRMEKAKYDQWKANKNRQNQIGFDVESVDFPDDLAAYGDNGEKVGLNFTQAFMRSVLLLRKARNHIVDLRQRIAALEAENETLFNRVKALEDAVFRP